MREPSAGRDQAQPADDAIPLLAVGSVLLRHRRLIVGLGLSGAVLGLGVGLLSPRKFTSAATFIPDGTDVGAASGLALAASQFGIRVPTTGSGWGPSIYVELLQSRALLEPIANDTVVLAEQKGRRFAVSDLLDADAPTPALRTDRTVRELRKRVTASEDKKLGAVKLAVSTKWPSVSLTVAERLVRGVNQFNLESRKTQALAERRFVEGQAAEAERALREAEDRLQSFLQRNRALGSSPELAFDRDRLQRDLNLRQQVYTSLMQSQEEAKIREVRNTPVITVLENPRLAVANEPRGSVQKALLGGIAGGLLGVLIAFLAHGMLGARRAPSEEAREFFLLVEEATPRFLRRGRR